MGENVSGEVSRFSEAGLALPFRHCRDLRRGAWICGSIIKGQRLELDRINALSIDTCRKWEGRGTSSTHQLANLRTAYPPWLGTQPLWENDFPFGI